MAVVLDGTRDFILFSQRPDSAFDSSASYVDSDFGSLPFDMDTHYPASQAELAAQTYDAFPVKEEQHPAGYYFDAFGNGMGALDASTEFPVSMSSTSPTVSHALDQASANFSLASGASAQSAASSTIGSPYSQHTPSLPAGPEQFFDSSNGLGIAQDLNGSSSADAFVQPFNPFLPGTDPQVVDDKSQSPFGVGEWPLVLPSSPANSLRTSSLSSSSLHSPVHSYGTGSSFLSPTSSHRLSIDGVMERQDAHTTKPPSLAHWSPSVSPNDPSSVSHMPNVPFQASNRLPSQRVPVEASRTGPTLYSSPQAHSQKRLADSQLAPSAKKQKSHVDVQHSDTQSTSPSSPSPSQFSQPSYSFFNQSSGRFIPPLQFSCWFSYCLQRFRMSLGFDPFASAFRSG